MESFRRLDLGHLCMRMVRGLVFMLMVDERFERSLDVGECDRFEGVNRPSIVLH